MELINNPSRLRELENIGQIKYFVAPIIVFLIVIYSIYLIIGQASIRQVGLVQEDGPIEYLTAIFFLVSSFFLLKVYISHKNAWLLFLGILMFFGAGEELSWGERIIGYDTPQLFEKYSVQTEANIHNLEIFNGHTKDGAPKSGLAKLITINFLFKLFWLSYGVILPIAYAYLLPISSLVKKMRLPVPPLSIGIFFLINWLIFRALINISEAQGQDGLYRISEVLEGGSAFLFAILALFFLINGPTRYLVDCPDKTHVAHNRQC